MMDTLHNAMSAVHYITQSRYSISFKSIKYRHTAMQAYACVCACVCVELAVFQFQQFCKKTMQPVPLCTPPPTSSIIRVPSTAAHPMWYFSIQRVLRLEPRSDCQLIHDSSPVMQLFIESQYSAITIFYYISYTIVYTNTIFVHKNVVIHHSENIY